MVHDTIVMISLHSDEYQCVNEMLQNAYYQVKTYTNDVLK
jgi:hypothetical protein